MPELHKSAYSFDKLSTLNQAKEDKLTNLTPEGVKYETAMLESFYDVDSPRFVGVTGGIGGTEDDGTTYDLTDQLTADRLKGIDSYEVFPTDERTQDYLFNDPRGIKKMDYQRARLAESRGVDLSEITNEDVFEEGAKGAVKELALLQAYAKGDADYLERVRNWEPESELTAQWRTSAPQLGSAESPLNIEVERAFLGEHGYYGRPLSQVRGKGSEHLLGVEGAGYTYGDSFKYTPPVATAEDMYQAGLQSQAEQMDFWDRIGSGFKALGRTFAKEAIVDFSDWVGESLDSLTGGKVGWNHGTEKQKTQAVNEVFGFNPYAAEADYAQAKIHADNIANAIYSDKEVSFDDVYELVKIGITTPEMLGDSVGFLASFFIPVLGWGGKAAKADKAIKGIEKAYKAGSITKEAAKKAVALEKVNINTLGKLRTFTQKNAGLMQVSAGNVNDQIDAYIEEHGSTPSVAKVGQMFATEALLLSVDRWADLSILKSPSALKGVRDAFSALTPEGKAKVLAKTAGVAVGLAANMGKEAAQEYTQEIGQEFNVKFNFDDNGEFFSVTTLDEAAEVLLDKDMQAKGILGAGLGAGGAVQFEAVGAIPKAVQKVTGEAGAKLGAANKKAKAAQEAALSPTEVAEEDLSPEQLAKRRSAADAKANTTVQKLARAVTDSDLTKIILTESPEEAELIDVPSLKEHLKQSSKNYINMIEEIEEAEAIIQSRQNTELAQKADDNYFKLLRQAKREVYRNLMEDEDHPTLGSGYTANDVIEEFVESTEIVNGERQISQADEIILQAYAEANDIPPLRFESLRKLGTDHKDAAAVHEEAFGMGERSASTYKNALRDLVNTPNPSRKAIAQVMDKIDNFLASQENRYTAWESSLSTMRANLYNYNKQINEGKNIPSALKEQYLAGSEVPGYDDAFIAVRQDKKTGKLEIHPESIAVFNSVKDNIDYLNRIKSRYGVKARSILGKEFSSADEGISVRPSSTRQKERDADQAYYDKRGVTKAIIDDRKDAQSKVWSQKGDYNLDNTSRVNTGQYSTDDVIVINSTAKGFSKNSKIRSEIASAYKAGATIVLDKAVANNQHLEKLLHNYHFKKVKEDGITKFMPEEKAAPIRSKQAKKVVKERSDNTIRRNLVKALDLEAQLGMAPEKAVASGKIDKKSADNYATAIEEALPLFGNDMTKMRASYKTVVSNLSKEYTDRLIDLAITKGYNSPELNEAMVDATKAVEQGKIPKTAVDNAFAAVEDKVAELEVGEQLLTDWNKAHEAAKRGELDIEAWVKKNVRSPRQIVKDLLDNSLGKGRKAIYSYFDGSDWQVKGNVDHIPKDMIYNVIEPDPSTFVIVSKTTPLNSFSARELRVAGQDNLAFNLLVDNAMELLGEAIRPPKTKYGSKDTSITEPSNSPAGMLVFDKDGKPNENVAIAMHLGLHTFIKNSAYLLKKGKKTKKDISEILGIDQSQLSREAVQIMSDKGLLYKTAANSIGKDIAKMLGISPKSDSGVDAQNYDTLIADLGQTALLMGIEQGILEKDDSVNSRTFARMVLRKDKHAIQDGDNAAVLFIQAVPGQEETIEFIADEAKRISETIPDVDVSRKEPSFKKIHAKRQAKITGKIRKERLGLKIANQSQKALRELMDTEWTADLSLMREMLADAELIKARLGYIEIGSDAYELLSFEEKEVQESINRGLDKSFEEMKWLTETTDKESASLWFEYFFSKNGRFFIDSNSINPQTDKHLHRFTVQPKSHTNKFVARGSKLLVGKVDVTSKVHYALAQAFGFATDKRDTAKIEEFGSLVLRDLNNTAKIKAAREQFLKEGKVTLKSGIELKIEHLGHALQAFDFLAKKVTSGKKPFSSAITAEFDAVTSGFGLKNLQMPIIEDLQNWLKKVGVLQNDDVSLRGVKSVSMNDILDSGEVRDSYQTLAADVEAMTFTTMYNQLPTDAVIADSEYGRVLWEALSDVLPKVENGEISGSLRTLFKYPFMTFNYSASIKSIRKNLLVGELLTSLSKEMASVDLHGDNIAIIGLMQALVGPKGDIAKLQKDIRTKPLYQIVTSGKKGHSVERYLSEMIEASYGVQVERILTEQFGPFVEAQTNVNNAFKAMFEIFAVSFEAKLEEARKKGAVSSEKEREIFEDLKAQWPMIKGPLSNMEQELLSGDGIGIYDTQTAAPTGVHAGRRPAKAHLAEGLAARMGQETITVSQMIKQMTAAVAAGSVVPIHYIDGAVMGQTINNLGTNNVKGITSIHDAIMPSLLDMNKAQREYNKQTLEVNLGYSFINEIMATLDRFLNEVPLDSVAYKTRKVQVGKESFPARDFLLKARNEMATLANRVNDGRELLFDTLNKGAKIMHMAGTAEGVYNVEAGTLQYSSVADYRPREYNSDLKVQGKEYTDIATQAKDLKC